MSLNFISPQDRQRILLKYADKAGRGLEIGPSHRPVAPKSAGYFVEVVDYADQHTLREHYRAHNVDLEKIEPVDHIWSGQKLSEVIGRERAYDWIIASHVVEHLPNLVQFFICCEKLLRDSGHLILAVPDCRRCFDFHRPISGLASLIDAYHEERKIHSAGTAAEYFLNVVSRGGKIAWDMFEKGPIHLLHTVENAKTAMHSVRKDGVYLDVHAWKFVPSSFRLILSDLHALGLIKLTEAYFLATPSHEFFCVLHKGAAHAVPPRRRLLEAIHEEMCEGYTG